MKFKHFFKKVKEYRQNLIEGNLNCIPLPFPRLRKYIPGTMRGTNIIVSANSGVGKTQFTKYLYVFHPFLWCRENNKRFKCFYFALEESKEEFIATAVCFFLDHFYNIEIEIDRLLSMNENPLPDYIIEKIQQLEPLVDEFLEVVTIEDNISNPFGIYKYVEQYATDNGTIHYKKMKINDEEVQVFDYYEPNDPDEYVEIITDHVSLLQPEKGQTLHQTISNFSAEYGRKKIAKRFNYINIIVQQQSAASEAKEYNNKGELNYSKLEPSLSDLADNKYTQRDAILVWGLFSPERYEIPNYMNWNIYKVGDNFRSLMVLKNRRGRSNIKTPLFFDGATNLFKELPYIDKNDINKKALFYNEFSKNKRFWFKNK